MLFNYLNDPNIDTTCDRWYVPERHHVFLYEDVTESLDVIGINPNFYNPESANGFDYDMPSFSCVAASRRKTNQIPNGESSPSPCISGDASPARYIAITPNHVLAIGHYYAVDTLVTEGRKHKFYGTVGGKGQQNYQKIKWTKLYKLGQFSGWDESMFDLPGELAILEFKAAGQNVNPTNDNEYNTSLGDPTYAPDVEIKYPYYLPEILSQYDTVVEKIESFPGIVFGQDIRGHIVSLKFSGLYSDGFNTPKENLSISWRGPSSTEPHGDIDTADLNAPHQGFIDDQLARKEDMGGVSAWPGDSGSLYFTLIPDMGTYTNNSPIFAAQLYATNFTNVLQDYIIPGVIEPYDDEHGTDYANAVWGRILTRQQLGIPEVGACCEDVGGGTECHYRSQSDCSAVGTYMGDNTICGTSDPSDENSWPCVGDEPEGACCVGLGGIDSCESVTQWECESLPNQLYMGNFTDCELCTLAEGACCMPDGISCEWLDEVDCTSKSGILFADKDCADVDCSENATGACCIVWVDEVWCIDWQTPQQCWDVMGTYKGDAVSCYDGICDVIGACCVSYRDSDNECLEISQLECGSLGTYKGDDTTCTAEMCDDDCVYCAGGSSPRNQTKSHPMDEPHTQTTRFETDYKKNHINEIEGINNYSKNNYSKVLLPSGECRWMDCSMMNGCPYPPCGE